MSPFRDLPERHIYMRRTFRFQRFVLSVAAVGTAVALAACGSQDAGGTGQSGDMANMPGMSQPAADANASFNDADVAFAQMMIPDHQMTEKMAKVAKKKASSKDLKDLAGQMVEGQSETVDMLQGWLKEWGKPATADMAGMQMPGAMTDKDMDMLESMNGMEFDMMFAEMMIKHHEGSMQMARDEQAKGASPEAKAMAADMLKEQQAQVKALQGIADM
jgi:uncharacterized protein (DUF305 family)